MRTHFCSNGNTVYTIAQYHVGHKIRNVLPLILCSLSMVYSYFLFCHLKTVMLCHMVICIAPLCISQDPIQRCSQRDRQVKNRSDADDIPFSITLRSAGEVSFQRVGPTTVKARFWDRDYGTKVYENHSDKQNCPLKLGLGMELFLVVTLKAGYINQFNESTCFASSYV